MKIIDGENRGELEWRLAPGNAAEIVEIGVQSQFRRMGAGRKMVGELIDLLRSRDVRMLYAITRQDNYIAQQFYEEIRFQVLGILRDLYTDSQSAVVYGFNLRSL